MGAVAVGAVLIAMLLVVIAAMVWQEARRGFAEPAATYVIADAARFVFDRLSDRAASRLDVDDVARILELGVHYHQVIRRGSGARPVIGSGDAIEYVMERSAAERGSPFEPLDIAEVMAVEAQYLMEIGAVGQPVDPMDEEAV